MCPALWAASTSSCRARSPSPAIQGTRRSQGGCLDTAGNITGVTAGSTACTVTNNNVTSPAAVTPDDFKTGTVKLGLTTGKVYEIGPGVEHEGSIESDVYDADMFSLWGRLSFDAHLNGGQISVVTRSLISSE